MVFPWVPATAMTRRPDMTEASAAARVRQGVVDPRSELTAAEASIQQQDALLQLDAAALSADVALQRALGGGYGESTKAL